MSNICVTGILGRARRDFPLSLPSSDLRAAELLWRTTSKKQKQAAPPLRVIDEQVFYITLCTDGEEGNMGRRRGGGLLDTTFVLWPETIFPHSRVIHESTPENAPHHATTTTFKSFYMVFMRNGSFLRPSSFLRTFPVEPAYRVKQVNYSIPYQGARRHLLFSFYG